MKNFALVIECGRQLDCKFFDSLKEATTELELTYKHCLQGRHSEAYIKEVQNGDIIKMKTGSIEIMVLKLDFEHFKKNLNKKYQDIFDNEILTTELHLMNTNQIQSLNNQERHL